MTERIAQTVADLRATFRAHTTRPLAWRLEQLRQLRKLLQEREEELIQALIHDLHKPVFEAWAAEIGVVITDIDHTIDHLPSWVAPTRAATPIVHQPGSSKVVHDPLGVVLIISPWNYPLQLLLAPLIGAIAGGNCAVLKPSEVAAHTADAIARLLPQYLDTRAFRVVQGGVPETTALLDQRFDHIFFTGSEHVGKIVMRAASAHLTPVTLELGGKSPCIIDRHVDLEVTARRIVWGKFLNAGQTCIAPDYLLVHRDLLDPLLSALRLTIADFFGPDPQRSPDLARIINGRHFDRLSALLDDHGGEVVLGGQRDPEDRYIAPTLLLSPSPDAPIMREEIFGPILPILPIDALDDAIAFVNDRPHPLALYVFSTDDAAVDHVLRHTASGGVCVNDTLSHCVSTSLPFGGVGTSGMGAYHGRHSFDTFTHARAVYTRSNLVDLDLRYPPYDASKLRWVRRLL